METFKNTAFAVSFHYLNDINLKYQIMAYKDFRYFFISRTLIDNLRVLKKITFVSGIKPILEDKMYAGFYYFTTKKKKNMKNRNLSCVLSRYLATFSVGHQPKEAYILDI